MRVRGSHQTVCVAFMVPSRPHRRCGWRVLRRRWRLWLAFWFNKTLGRPYCHCVVSDMECFRSITFGRPKWYAHIPFLHHPCLGAVVLLLGNDRPSMQNGVRFLCVSDVRSRLREAGIETRWCLLPSSLFKQLQRSPHAQRTLVHARAGRRSDPRAE